MSEVSLKAAFEVYRKYSSGHSIRELCEGIARGRSEYGMNVRYIYSFIGESGSVQLFYSEIEVSSKLAESPFVKDYSLIWEKGKLCFEEFGVDGIAMPTYLSEAYSKLLLEANPHILDNIKLDHDRPYESIRDRLFSSYLYPGRSFAVDYIIKINKDKINSLKKIISGSQVIISDTPEHNKINSSKNQVIISKKYIRLDREKINKDVDAVKKAAESADGCLSGCNLKPIETLENFSAFERGSYHLSSKDFRQRYYKKILILILVLSAVITAYSIVTNQIREAEELDKKLKIPLKGDFTVTVEPGFVPLLVKFKSVTKGMVELWDWDFGDGGGSLEKNPEHVYEEKGIYSVTLKIENRYHTDTIVKKDFVKIEDYDIALWEKQESTTRHGLNDIFFISEKIFYVCGNSGTILKTIDGGENWINLEVDTRLDNYSIYPRDINSLFFINEKIGWITGNGFIFRTNDGAKSWLKQKENGLNYIFIIFKDSLNGRVYTANSGVFKTNDGGNTWDLFRFPPNTSSFNLVTNRNIEFLNFNLGWVVSQVGINAFTLFKIGNDSQKWLELLKSNDEDFNSFVFADSLNGYLVSSKASENSSRQMDYIYKTRDGGKTWDIIKKSNSLDYRKIYYRDRNKGWILTDKGKFMFTNNGGSSWKTDRLGALAYPTCFKFLDEKTGFVLCNNGFILKWIGQE